MKIIDINMFAKHKLSYAFVALFSLLAMACSEKKFEVKGEIKEATDSLLYFENMSLEGPVVVDSLKLDANGRFSFSKDAPSAPEFYRLRIANSIINVSVDSTETIEITASYPTMASGYTVKGSENCSKIKDLALQQMRLQQRVNAIVQSPLLGVKAVEDSINKVLAVYKENIRTNFIYKEPMKAYAYFALFQSINIGNEGTLIFNPRSNSNDVKAFAAVATSWDTYYPNSERGLNLHNIAIEGMKNIRIMKTQNELSIDASKVDMSNSINISLTDNKGRVRNLQDLVGKVVLLDFHLFASKNSMQRIMMLRELYNKYHNSGLEIYQVSIDGDEHFWKTQTAALPWVCVRETDASQGQSLMSYNVQNVPTFFLLKRDNSVYKRDTQVGNLDAEIASLLKQ
jgi:lipoprotein